MAFLKPPIYVTSRPEIEEYRLVFIASLTSLTLSCSQNMYNIQILVVLLVPGLTYPTFLPLSILAQRLPCSTVGSLSPHAPSPMHAQLVPQAMRTECTLFSTRSFRPLSAARRRKGDCENGSPICTSFHNSSTSSLQPTSPTKVDSGTLSKKDPTRYLLSVEKMIENDYFVSRGRV